MSPRRRRVQRDAFRRRIAREERRRGAYATVRTGRRVDRKAAQGREEQA